MPEFFWDLRLQATAADHLLSFHKSEVLRLDMPMPAIAFIGPISVTASSRKRARAPSLASEFGRNCAIRPEKRGSRM